jgi:hypothetical protein
MLLTCIGFLAGSMASSIVNDEPAMKEEENEDSDQVVIFFR